MTADNSEDQQEQILDFLPEAELLAIPDQNIPPEYAAALQERKAAIREQEVVAQSVAGHERQQQAEEIKQREHDSRREEALLEFERTMQDIQERSQELLQRLEEQETQERQRLEEIDKRAIVLKDGRRVYVDGKDGYVDDKGVALKDRDEDEARGLREQNPDAATWREHADAQRRYDETRRLREKVENLKDDAAGENGKGLTADELDTRRQDYDRQLTADEKEFREQTQERTASLSAQGSITDQTYGGADYMAAYQGKSRTTSFASTLDNAPSDETLTNNFTLAASGQNTASSDKSVQPGPANTSANFLPSPT